MALEYYDESEPMPEGGSDQGDMEKMEDSGKTALIDSSLCPGMKPGDEFTVRVEKVLDSGEYVLSYPGKESETSDEPMMEEEMAPESEMESVMG